MVQVCDPSPTTCRKIRWELDFNNNTLMYLVYALFIDYGDLCCSQCWASYF